MTFEPERASRWHRIYVQPLPPCCFVAGAVQLAMMSPTQRHGELIADLSPHGAALREPKMMRV